MRCHTLFPGQKVKSCRSFLQCPLHGSMPIWPIRVICGTNSANEGTMCHVPLTFPGQKVKVIQVIHICTAEVWAWISNSTPMTNDELSMSHPDLYTRSVMYMVLNQSWRSCTGTVQTLTVWKILKKAMQALCDVHASGPLWWSAAIHLTVR